MPVMPGTSELKEATGEFDFAVDGGAIGTITLRSRKNLSTGNDIPAGSVIVDGYVEIDTGFTSGGAATVAAGAETTADLVAATVASGSPWSAPGRYSLIETGAGALTAKTTVRRFVTLTIAVAALTAGKGRVVTFYR